MSILPDHFPKGPTNHAGLRRLLGTVRVVPVSDVGAGGRVRAVDRLGTIAGSLDDVDDI